MKTIKIKLHLLGLMICLTVCTAVFGQSNSQVDYRRSKIAYPFELKDKNGKLVRMKDFKGKVVVLEFWYTGCAPCLGLAKPMAEMREYYKDNPHVVFVDINLDKDIAKWKNSLQNSSEFLGERVFYTDSLSISLSTAPVGFFNEITSYYKITGVPALIIIGAKGEILQRNPPRPRPKESGIESVGSLRFKALISEYLLPYLKPARVR